MKAKAMTPEQAEEIRTKDFFDMILPGTIKFMSDHYIVGDSYRCAWVVREYPPSTEEQAILSQLADRSGVTLRIYHRLVESGEQRKIIQNATRRNKLKRGGGDVSETVEAEGNLQDVVELLANLRKNREPLLHCAVFLELKARSLDGLRELQSDIAMELTRSKISVDRLTLRQKEGFLSVLPVGFNRFGSQYERVLPASSVANLYPFNFSGKTDPRGLYLGRDKFGTNILVDFERRAEDKTTSNILILGNSGQGKSYLLKLILTNLRESGKALICLDPESEYESLCSALAHWTEDDGKFSVQYDEDGEGSTMTITLTQEGLAEVNRTTTIYPSGSVCSGYSDCYLVIRYAATINNEAVLGDEANPNLVTLKWKRTNTAYYDILEDDCHVYSYGIDLLKQFHGANDQDADGNFSKVKFILRNETDDYFLSADLIDGVYYIRDHVEEKDATVFSPDAEGKILIRGLEDDIYRLKEIATDYGYQLLAEEVKIEIIASESAAICNVCGRSLLTATAKVTDQEVIMEADGASAQAFVPLTIINNHGFDLPPTGSQGTWFLSILGIAGMAVCGVLLALLLKKRKQNTA